MCGCNEHTALAAHLQSQAARDCARACDQSALHCRTKQQAKAAEAEEERLLADEYQALLAEQDAAREAALTATFARSAARAEQAGSGVLEAAQVLILLLTNPQHDRYSRGTLPMRLLR